MNSADHHSGDGQGRGEASVNVTRNHGELPFWAAAPSPSWMFQQDFTAEELRFVSPNAQA
jgi:hypothetical protein